GLALIVAAAIDEAADRTRAAVSAGRIAAGAYEPLGFLAVVDHRTYDAVGARVETLHDDGRVVPRYAHERRDAGRRDRLHHQDRALVIDETVLQVDDERIPSERRHDLGGKAVRNAEPAVDDRSALVPDRAQVVGPHRLSPSHAVRARSWRLAGTTASVIVDKWA